MERFSAEDIPDQLCMGIWIYWYGTHEGASALYFDSLHFLTDSIAIKRGLTNTINIRGIFLDL